MKNLKYISLKNVLGNTLATDLTVNLFNACRPQLKDKKGTFIELAIKPHLIGVLVTKKYI